MRLDIIAGKAAGLTILVDDGLLIGRQVVGAGRLADDEEISRTHARVSVDESGACSIEDLGSTNGTFVNGARIATARTLAEGDMIELGSTTMVVGELSRPAVDEEAGRTLVERPIVSDLGSVAEPADPDATTMDALEPAPASPHLADADAPAPPPGIHAPPPPPAPAPPLVVAVEEEPLSERPPAERPPLTLSLRLEIDPAGAEARLWFAEGAEPLRLILEEGAWRPLDEPTA